MMQSWPPKVNFWPASPISSFRKVIDFLSKRDDFGEMLI